MKDSKIAMIIIYIVYALPIPLSMITWIGTIMAIAAIGNASWSGIGALGIGALIVGIVAALAMIIIYIVYALPIPLFMIPWIGTIMAIAAIGNARWSEIGALIVGIVATLAMLLAGTYLISYIYSLIGTLKQKKLTKISLLPLLHIVITITLLTVWFSFAM